MTRPLHTAPAAGGCAGRRGPPPATPRTNDSAAGSVQGLHLVVTDLAAAREELVGRGVPVGDPYHFGEQGQVAGVHPDRADFSSFAGFADPDGNGWLLQERSARS